MKRAVGAAAGLLLAPWIAHAQEHRDHGVHEAQVVLTRSSVDPRHATVLEGEEVVWRNGSSRTHTVSSPDGHFDARLSPARTFRHRFDSVGTHAYSCRIHPTITGTVAVRRVVLEEPPRVAVRGERVSLGGRAAAGIPTVGIEADYGEGFVRLTDAVVDADGGFHAEFVADRDADYRAVAGPDASDPVGLEVVDARRLTLGGRLARGRAILAVRAIPAAPYGRVLLQVRLPERFGWWPVRRARLDARSRARFTYPRDRSVLARVVLVRADGATVLARSDAFRIRAGGRASTAG